MKNISLFITIIIVGLLCFTCGYLTGNYFANIDHEDQEESIDYKIESDNPKGKESKSEISEAYIKGWSYWFSSYGMNGEGMLYIDRYDLGRRYNSDFSSTKEAFFAGYDDGFYFKNKKEVPKYTDEQAEKMKQYDEGFKTYDERKEEGYKSYYPD